MAQDRRRTRRSEGTRDRSRRSDTRDTPDRRTDGRDDPDYREGARTEATYQTEAKKPELVEITDDTVPAQVSEAGLLRFSVTVANSATVIYPGDGDRCGNDIDGKIGYETGLLVEMGGRTVQRPSDTLACIPAFDGSATWDVVVRPPDAGIHTLTVSVILPGSGTTVDSFERLIEVTAEEDDSGDGDTPDEDPADTPDDSGDDTNDTPDDTNETPDDSETPPPEDDPTPEEQSIGEWWANLPSDQKLLYSIGGGLGAVALLKGNSGRR